MPSVVVARAVVARASVVVQFAGLGCGVGVGRRWCYGAVGTSVIMVSVYMTWAAEAGTATAGAVVE